ncbi:retrovirus-related pol polyprotein from transposon TNT 1-94 [Tanacetum coccineum]
MSTSKTYQQSLADAGSETRPPMLERGSYIPWASRFRRYINRKRENRKWLNKALDEGPYKFEMFIPNNLTVPKLQTAEDLQGDALLHYDAEMELMNLILLSILKDIYNSVDACTSAKDMWKRVERLMRGTIQNKVDRETCFTKKFDQFVAEPGEALVSIYNRFAQLMNDLKRNEMHFPIVTTNTKFLNSLQPEWLKYVTQVRLAKRLTVDTFDDLFYYLQQFKKLVNVSRAKKLEKSHDPLALVAHTGSSSRNTSSYYVTHPTSVVDYEDEYQQDDVHTNSEDPLASAMLLLARAITQKFSTLTNNRLRTSSNTRNQAIIQGDRVNIQSKNSGNAGRNNRRAYVQEEIVEGSNAPNETGNVQRILRTSSSGNTSTVQCYNCSGKGHYARNCLKPRVWDSKYFMEQMLLAKQDEAGVILTDEQNDFLFADASRMEEIEELSANICLMARIQPADNTSDAGPSYDSAFISEVQSSSNNENEQQMYPTHTKIINSTIGDDQIDSNIIFDSPNGNVNSGSIEKDTHVPDLCALEQLARNAYQEAEKQQIFAQKADKRAKHFSQQAQSQFVRDRDIIRDLEKQRDKLDLDVKDYKRQNEELQKTHSILKRQMSENEDKYHDTVLDLEAKLKKNVDLILKLGNSLQGMFMLGPKPLSVYDQQLKHGLGYPNPYTLKQAISQCPKLYLASSLGNSEISLNVRDTEDTLDDASKSQQKVYEKMNDPIAVANKQNCWTIDYAQINALYKDFVPQKELSAEQKYFPSSFIPSDKNSNATPSIPASMPKSELCELEKHIGFLKDQLLEVSLKYEVKLSVLLNHECVDNLLHAEIEQLKKKSIKIQEGLQARIKILEKDVQRCEKQSVDFELKLQHEKEKHKWDSSFKNKNTNPLDYSWISKMEKLENDNVSLDFQVQSLIKERDNVKLEYQKLFDSIKKTRSQTQKEMDELIDHVSEKTYAYGVIRMNDASSVRRPMNRDSNVKKSVLANSKFSAKKVEVYVRKNKQTDNTSANVISNKEDVIDVANVPKAKVVLCVSCMKNVLIPCHDKCLANYKLNVHSNVRRALLSKPRTPKSSDTTHVISKTRFSKKLVQSKSLDTTPVVSKTKIDEGSVSKAKNKVSSATKLKKGILRDMSLNNYMKDKIRTSRIWQKWFEAKPNVVWSPVNTTPNVHSSRSTVIQIVLWIVDSGCSKHMTGDRSLLRNFIEKFMGTVRFGNDNFAAITGYGDYIQGNITICHVYYVEGLRHNLFSVGQFCDGDLEVAFRSKTCYVRNLEGDDFLTGGREFNLYTISISDMAASSPVYPMSKATSTKSWLWHRRLSHLNFCTINDLTRLDLVDGLPKFKYGKDHLCSACERGKSKKASHPPKLVASDHSKLELLHMDLCSPMRIRTDNGTEFKNATLKAHYEKLSIMQQFSTARTPQQNGVVERRNRTLVEAARTMLIFSRLPEFLWAEAVATTCFTQNRSIIHTRYNKTPYELLRGRKPNAEYFHVIGSLCYPTNDQDDLGKMKPKADIGVFIGYSETSRGFRIYNRRTKKIMKTIHVKFDELTIMASKYDCLEPVFQ